MFSLEVWIVLLSNGLVHSFIFHGELHVVINMYNYFHEFPKPYWFGTICQCLLVLVLFPLFGTMHILNRIWLTIVAVAMTTFALLLLTVIESIRASAVDHMHMNNLDNMSAFQYALVFFLLFGTLGQMLFEINAIIVGIDQMLDAPSEKLSAMIHWYFWFQFLFHVVVYYITISSIYCSSCQPQNWLLYISVVGFLLSLIALILLVLRRKKFHFEPLVANPLKRVYEILFYAAKHSRPYRRSAFTYFEIPNRLDFAAERYGGPYKEDHVEDTKVFLRVLVLLLSMTGYYVVGDAFIANHYNAFQSKILCLFFGFNTSNVRYLVMLVGIPLYRLVLLPLIRNYSLSMLKRISIGMFCSFLSIIATTIILIPSVTSSHQLEENATYACSKYIVEFNNGSSANATTPENYIILIPEFFNGLSYFFVFMTIFEFIFAQAPKYMIGLLIGIWYSLSSLQLAVNLIDVNMTFIHHTVWYIYQAVKVGIFITSLIFFVLVLRRFKLRQRGDPGTLRTIIEGVIERNINRRIEIERESERENERLLFTVQSSASINST